MASNATKRMRREQDALCSDTNANTIMISSTILASDDSKDFSGFPHDILSHILSFLPTKDAVATSALSKRWKHLWKSVNNLDFDDRLFRSPELENKPAMKNCFVKFVDSVLRGLSRPTIDRFSLRLHNCIYHPSPLDAWITAISGLGLRKLSITYDFSDMEDDPLNLDPLFNYSSLVELELAMMITIGFPSSTSLSNLKVLKIYLMDIVSQSKEMVLSFPVLKVFRADCCSWLSIRDVILEAPMLETVIIIHIFIVENRSIDVFSEQQQKTAIKIVAPCLKNFVYLGFAIEEIILSNPLSVVNVFLEINEMKKSRWGEVGDRVCKLLKGFQRMEDLKLGPTAVEMITHADDYVSKLPVLPCLVSLVTDVDNYLPSQEFLLNLLHKLPILERLELCSGFERFDNDLFPSAVPECLLSTLKIVKINFFMWSEVEICLAKYMLENSRVLEELNITIKIETTVSMEKVKHDLLSFNRASRILSVKVEMTKPEDLWDFDSYCIHSNGGIQLVYE